MQRLKRRDAQAMMELYDRYGKLVYSVIVRAVKNPGAAEDIAQETFLRIWNRIHTFDEQRGKLEAWLVTVARNRAIDYLRSLRGGSGAAFARLDDIANSALMAVNEPQAERIARESAVREALQRLKDEQREVIELTHFEGLTQTEIAAHLNKPLGTVKGLVRSALRNLRLAMAPESAA